MSDKISKELNTSESLEIQGNDQAPELDCELTAEGGENEILDQITESDFSAQNHASEEKRVIILSPDDIFSEDAVIKDESPQDSITQADDDTSSDEDESTFEGSDEPDSAASDNVSKDAPEGTQYKLIHMPTRSPEADFEKLRESTSEAKSYNPDSPRLIDKVFEFVELFVFTLVAVMLISSFFFRHSIVDGPSMENTLYHGEHLIITNLFYTPKQGDIIVCDDHTTALKKPIVKRVIATEGQRVTITPDGVVKVDGIPLPEEYVYLSNDDYIYEPYDDVIPEGKIFVMGDHRDNSSDSREPLVGPIDVRSVLGKVILRIYPFARFGTVD